MWQSTWHSELVLQSHLSQLGESLPSSLVAEVARSTAGRLLPSDPLVWTWLIWFRCWHAVPLAMLNLCGSHARSELDRSPVRLLRFLLTDLTPASPGAIRTKFSLELSAPPDNKSRFLFSVKQSRLHYHDVGAYIVARLYMHSFLRSERSCSHTTSSQCAYVSVHT